MSRNSPGNHTTTQAHCYEWSESDPSNLPSSHLFHPPQSANSPPTPVPSEPPTPSIKNFADSDLEHVVVFEKTACPCAVNGAAKDTETETEGYDSPSHTHSQRHLTYSLSIIAGRIMLFITFPCCCEQVNPIVTLQSVTATAIPSNQPHVQLKWETTLWN